MNDNERERLTRALQVRAEEGIPDQLMPSEQTLKQWRTSAMRSRNLATYSQLANSTAAAKPTVSTARRQLKVSAAMIMICLLALATLSLALILATRPQIAGPKPMNNNFVPEGKVRHVVISYTDAIANRTPTGTDDSGEVSSWE